MTPANETVRDDTTPKNIFDFLLSVLKSFSIDAVSLTLGKGESGWGQSRNWQRGPQPSLTSNTNSLSLGTVFSTSVIHSLKKVVDSSSPFSILSNRSATMRRIHPPVGWVFFNHYKVQNQISTCWHFLGAFPLACPSSELQVQSDDWIVEKPSWLINGVLDRIEPSHRIPGG